MSHVPAQPANTRELPVYHYSHMKANRRLQHLRSKPFHKHVADVPFIPTTHITMVFILLSYSSFIKLLVWTSWFWFLPVYSTGDEEIPQMLKALPQLQTPSSSPQLRGVKAFLELKDREAIPQKSMLHEKLLKEVESWTNLILINQHLFWEKETWTLLSKELEEGCWRPKWDFFMQTTCKPCIRLLVFLISFSYLLCWSDTVEEQGTYNNTNSNYLATQKFDSLEDSPQSTKIRLKTNQPTWSQSTDITTAQMTFPALGNRGLGHSGKEQGLICSPRAPALVKAGFVPVSLIPAGQRLWTTAPAWGKGHGIPIPGSFHCPSPRAKELHSLTFHFLLFAHWSNGATFPNHGSKMYLKLISVLWF